MRISISVEKAEPLTGTAATEAGGQLPFEGWLELLRVISELVCSSRGDEGSREAPRTR